MTRTNLAIATLGATLLMMFSASASAGLFEDLYNGLEIAARPTGFPLSTVSGGGLSNGARFGRVRIVPTMIGNGHRLEFDRTFGVDARGREERYDFGNLELLLNGQVQTEAWYTRRGIPTANFRTRAATLVYRVTGKTGAQDFELGGTLDVSEGIEVNALGFYTLQVNVRNADSSLNVDGSLANGDLDTDFDIGPISVSGNIFADLAIGGLSTLGVDTTRIEQFFPYSPIDLVTEEIRNRLEAQALTLSEQVVTDPTLGSDGTLEAKYLLDDAGGPFVGPPDPIGSGFDSTRVPEPSCLMLLGLGLLALRRRK